MIKMNGPHSRREYLAFVGSGSLGALAGCTGGDEGDGPPDDGTDDQNGNGGGTGTNSPTGANGGETPGGTEKASGGVDSNPTASGGTLAPDVQSFSGSGNTVLDGVVIEADPESTYDTSVVIAEATHDGDGEFVVSVEPYPGPNREKSGGSGGVVGSGDGQYDGTGAAMIRAGEYELSVGATGSWTVDLRQPRPETGDALSRRYAGDQSTVLGPITFTGSGTMSVSGEVSDWFRVDILERSHHEARRIFDFSASGQFEESRSYTADGIGWIDVTATGTWEIEIE